MAATQCALLFAAHIPIINYIYCNTGGLGMPCTSCQGEKSLYNCTKESETWYQDALYSATGTTSNGTHVAQPMADKIILTPGVVNITTRKVAWHPLGTSTGLHVPSNVTLTGMQCSSTSVSDVVVIRASPLIANASSRLSSLIVVSNQIQGWGPNEHIPGAFNVTISNIIVSGSSNEVDVENDLTCNPKDVVQGNAPSVVDPSNIIVERGIFLPVSSGSIFIKNVTVLHTFGNGIETGMYDQWVPRYMNDKNNPVCANGTKFCKGNVLWFNGTSFTNPNVIANNTLCDNRFGGITIIGNNVLVTKNHIAVSKKEWTSSSQMSGTTMGVSAAFVGTSNVTVSNNTIYGGDYGVGSDGSYPLYVSIPMFTYYWGDIYKSMPPSFQKRYSPKHPPLDSNGNLAFQTVDDFVHAQQRLLDIATTAENNNTDVSVYDGGFGKNIVITGNNISYSVVGVSLYRQKDTIVSNNVLENAIWNLTTIFTMWGISIDHSHNTTTTNNIINNWNGTGIMVQGRPMTLSRLGGSFNTIITNSISYCRQGITFRNSGIINTVENNAVMRWKNGNLACDFSGAICTGRMNLSWGNIPQECNTECQ
eukprot:m.74493 g.74493  ORF g.74493 m.74493 type:complete len:591 (+) comp12466_c0_seq2:45-1817(+)